MSNPIAADLRNWLSLHGYVKELPQEQEVALLRAIEAAIYATGWNDSWRNQDLLRENERKEASRAEHASESELLNQAVKMLANYSSYNERERAEFYAKVNRAAPSFAKATEGTHASEEDAYNRGFHAALSAVKADVERTAHGSELEHAADPRFNTSAHSREAAMAELAELRKAHASESVELTCPHCHAKHTHYIDTDQYQRGYAAGWEGCDNEAKISAAHASEKVCEKCGRVKHGDHGKTCYHCEQPAQAREDVFRKGFEAAQEVIIAQGKELERLRAAHASGRVIRASEFLDPIDTAKLAAAGFADYAEKISGARVAIDAEIKLQRTAHLSCEAVAKQDASDTTAFTHDAQPEEFESRAAHGTSAMVDASESLESAYHRGCDTGWEAHKERAAQASDEDNCRKCGRPLGWFEPGLCNNCRASEPPQEKK